MIEIRKAEQRGHANHGWLDTYHSFSFADYYDPRHMGFGPLRVINEDRIGPAAGFGMHGHKDMEIITYVLDGELTHEDSMGNRRVIHAGEVQRMSAGVGVRHSEANSAADRQTHFLQIWIEPNVSGIAPGYEEKRFEESQKRGRLRLIADPEGSDGAARIHQDARVYAGLFDGAERNSIRPAAGRRIYVHVARGQVSVNGIELHAGDGLKAEQETALEISDGRQADILLFDLP